MAVVHLCDICYSLHASMVTKLSFSEADSSLHKDELVKRKQAK